MNVNVLDLRCLETCDGATPNAWPAQIHEGYHIISELAGLPALWQELLTSRASLVPAVLQLAKGNAHQHHQDSVQR